MGIDELKLFFSMLKRGSKGNDDAYGYFNRTISHKEGIAYHNLGKKIRKKTIKELDGKHDFLVGHNRLATTGDEKINHNNHPFGTKDYLMVHNGIISNHCHLKAKYELKYVEETDSAIVINMIQMYSDGGDDDLKAIQKTMKQISGSYSIFVFNKTKGKLYYLKNSGAKFYFMRIKDRHNDLFVGSTNWESIEQPIRQEEHLFNDTAYEPRIPDSLRIYEITKGNINVIGTFEECKEELVSYGHYKYNSKYDDGLYDYDLLEEFMELEVYPIHNDCFAWIDNNGLAWIEFTKTPPTMDKIMEIVRHIPNAFVEDNMIGFFLQDIKDEYLSQEEKKDSDIDDYLLSEERYDNELRRIQQFDYMQ
jgi:hypothetical protein